MGKGCPLGAKDERHSDLLSQQEMGRVHYIDSAFASLMIQTQWNSYGLPLACPDAQSTYTTKC